jgi:hypothetical protein
MLLRASGLHCACEKLWSKHLYTYMQLYIYIKPNSVRITESLTLVSDPTSHRFIRWLLFQTFNEWSRALDVRLSEWCCSVSMVWVQIPSREKDVKM